MWAAESLAMTSMSIKTLKNLYPISSWTLSYFGVRFEIQAGGLACDSFSTTDLYFELLKQFKLSDPKQSSGQWP